MDEGKRKGTELSSEGKNDSCPWCFSMNSALKKYGSGSTAPLILDLGT
jgi:3-methyladenine DNA glycosylase AlkC